MKTQKFYSRAILSAGVAPVVLGLAMVAAPAYAQTAPQAADDKSSDEIVVTGSLISNPNLERSSPVNVTTAEEIDLKQSNVAEEVLREIPGVVPNIGAAVNNGNGGASYVDLRGLGSNRNLVLLDGNRLVPSGLIGRVDLNNIPLALVDRVDVTTGSSVTTYGADAITGVVNFITKRDFAGFEASLSESITGKGDGNAFRADVTIGANFDDGRGNAVFSIGYQQSDPVYQGARSFSVNNVDSFSGAAGGSGTTLPARFSVPGLGTRQINPATGALQGGFVPFNFNPYNIFQTPFTRFNMYGAAHYQVSDAIEFYTRGIFSKNDVKTIIAPSGVFSSIVTIPVSNPYLPAAARATFCANNDFDAVTAGVQTLTPAQCAAAALATTRSDPNYREFTTTLRRRFVETGPRISDFQTTIFDYKVGAKGGITDSINWDVSGAYGQSENIQTLGGYVLTSRVRDALLATNTTSCLSGAAGCVPLNIFGGANSITAAQAAYVQSPSTTTIKTSLAQVKATISGETGFALPWASDQVNFAVGGEYRKYHADQIPDSLSQIPGELGGAGGAAPEIHGGYDVYEAIGELAIPVVQDKPFFENLTIGAGIRYSSYRVDAPGKPSYKATTYRVDGSWKPGGGLTLRGQYSRAVRAPNINELFSPLTTGLTNLATDPCAGAQTAAQVTATNPLNAKLANPAFAAVCLAQGAPANAIGLIPNPTAGQANSTTGGNLGLKPEKADTYTVGVVYQPEFVKGLSITVDYYNIKIGGAVSTATPGDVINACFNSSNVTVSNPACAKAFIGRDPTTGALDGDPATTFGLLQTFSNLGRITTDGVDVSVNYKRDIGFADLILAFNGNYTHSQKFQASPTSINRECVGFYSVNCSFTGSIQPKFHWTQRTTLKFNAISASLLWNHISSVKQEPLDADPVNGSGPAFGTFGKIKSFDYFDLAGRFEVSDNMTLTVRVANIFDRKPPVVGSTIGSTSFNSGNTYPSTYDALGRDFSVGLKLKF